MGREVAIDASDMPALVAVLRDAGTIPESAKRISIRGDEGSYLRIAYDEIVNGEESVTTRRMTKSDASAVVQAVAGITDQG